MSEIQPNLVLALVAAVGIGVYILSWYLSIAFFKKREPITVKGVAQG